MVPTSSRTFRYGLSVFPPNWSVRLALKAAARDAGVTLEGPATLSFGSVKALSRVLHQDRTAQVTVQGTRRQMDAFDADAQFRLRARAHSQVL
jgi:hypothetical protein